MADTGPIETKDKSVTEVANEIQNRMDDSSKGAMVNNFNSSVTGITLDTNAKAINVASNAPGKITPANN